jgi:hypothetical protein
MTHFVDHDTPQEDGNLGLGIVSSREPPYSFVVHARVNRWDREAEGISPKALMGFVRENPNYDLVAS